MTEKLVLTAPDTFPNLTDWQILDLYISRKVDGKAPVIKATVLSNTNKRFVVRYTPEVDGEAVVVSGLKFINDGEFVGLGKTLQRWLLERFTADGKLGPGTITGIPD